VIYTLPALSDAIAALAAAAAPWLAAIRVGPNQHITGIAWGEGLIVTTDQALPPRDGYALVMHDGALAAATALHRAPLQNLALLRVDRIYAGPAMAFAEPPAIGNVVVMVGADYDGSPTVRLTAIHRQPRAPDQGAVLDLTEARTEPGGLVLNSAGAVLGIAQVLADGTVAIVPHETIAHFIASAAGLGISTEMRAAPIPSRPGPATMSRQPTDTGRRGWFGVALQPITVPEPLVPRAGQASGRLVVGVTPGGPAERAGIRIGDVLLSLDGFSTSGANSLRRFLEGSRIGSKVEARLLRDAVIATAWLTVAEHP
jgi:S1-C subfamily serine protease